MKKTIHWTLMLALVAQLFACTGKRAAQDDDLALDGTDQTAAADAGPAAGSNPDDDFAEFDKSAEEKAPAEQPQQQQQAAAGEDDELKLDDEPAPQQTAENPPPAEQPPAAEPAPTEPAPVAETPPAEQPVDQALAAPAEPAPPAEVAPPETPAVANTPPSSGRTVITGIKYRANDNGGTVVIEANGPVTFTSRSNPDQKQLIVEVPDAILPRRLQRPINTRDIQGSIGAIDPYQHAGSNVARFVIQLREGAPDPVLQQEGNSILVVANGMSSAAAANNGADGDSSLTQGDGPGNVDLSDSKILASQSLAEYLSGNTKFYGKKISLEMNSMDVRDALRFITEESGVNMVVAEEVKGNVSLKLRQVPWDQALIVIMKAKKLGYSRTGNVLRITTLDQLKQEEDDATKLVKAKQDTEPLKVRMFPISYARVDDVVAKVRDFLSGGRGKAIGDSRTNAMVVTDIEENLQRVARLVQGLDLQPPQVLIEGKIVEAQETFTRNIGINWGFSGSDIRIGTGKNGPVNMRPSLSTNPFAVPGGQSLNFNLQAGVFDIFGDLSAALALHEKDDKVKIISSPRIVTLTNEPANIRQTTEVPLQSISQNGTSSIVSITYKPLTLELDVTPQITADGSIIMKLKVRREFQGASSGGTNETAPVNSREANTRVLVRNGQTAVIGGIYQSDATDGETGVPYLREIPFLGALFRGRTKSRVKTELLLFVTPRIMAANEGGASPPPGNSDL